MYCSTGSPSGLGVFQMGYGLKKKLIRKVSDSMRYGGEKEVSLTW